MLISVIIPAYRAAATIREALETVEAQTAWESNRSRLEAEIIVVDDASGDETAAVAEAGLHASGLRLQVLRLPSNMGPAAARNRGIAQAKGEWIAFLDADDAWLPDKIEVQLSLAAQQPDVAMWCGETAAVWECGSMGVGEDGSGGEKAEGGTPNIEHRTPKAERFVSGIRRLRLADFGCGNPVATSTVLIRKAALDEVGGFDEQFRGPEDYDLWMRVAARFPAALIEAPLARYRSLPGSLSMDDRSFLPQVLKVLDKAYGPGGVLRGIASKRLATGYQHLACAWMAAERGAMARAWRLFLASLALWPWSYQMSGRRLAWAKSKLLARLVSRAIRGRQTTTR